MSTAIVVNGIGEPLTEELEGIFREHYPMVYRTAYSLTGSPQDAEDIVQSLFLQLLRLRFPVGLKDNAKALRQETREIPVYALVLGKDGPKVEVSPEGAGGFMTGNRTGDESGYVQVKWRGNTSAFAAGLSGIVGDRPVLDRTGLTSRYLAEFSYVPEAALLRGVFGPSIFDSIEELGFKLEPVRASVEFLIIEHIEKPSEN